MNTVFRYLQSSNNFNSFRQWVSLVPRRSKKAFLIVLDFVVLTSLVWLSFYIRFNMVFTPTPEQILLILAAPIISIPIFVRMGLYRSVLRYLPERAIWTILRAVTIATLLWVSLAFLTQMTGAEGIPRSVPLIFWGATVAFMVGSRFGAKWLLWGQLGLEYRPKQTLIYGTGDAGIQLVNALRSTNERLVVGFISDDSSLYGLEVLGLRVYPPSEIERIVTNMGVQEVIITTTSPSMNERRELIARLGLLPVKLRILPPIADIAAGRYIVSFVRDIDIDDLLGRSEVAPDPGLLHAAIDDRSILVTGAAGSIGSALCRIVAGLSPRKLVLMDINEHGIYQTSRELRELSNATIVNVLGSVTDREVLKRTIATHKIDTIFHCAAYKHVSLVEENVLEGVRNNVYGTWTTAEVAVEAGVGTFVLISSDKAVRPASIMGATKRWSELIVRHFANQAKPSRDELAFCSVRFGNVIGSSGSVVPLFKEQIARGGPVTITHSDMMRYFMSVREAAELIIQASALSTSGDILLLEMGQPVRIRDLAEDMIKLAGLTVRDGANPAGDIEIVAIGARQGEKIREELFYDPDGVTPTRHPKILRAKRPSEVRNGLDDRMAALRCALDAQDENAVRKILFDYVAS